MGNDSLLWKKLNRKGHTVFLENDISWIKDQDAYNVHQINYITKLSEWRENLADSANYEKTLHIDMPLQVLEHRWDLILVDSPRGFGQNPGRLSSIYYAAKLAYAHPNTAVAVHDINRPAERAATEKFFYPSDTVSYTHLRAHET